MLTEKEKASLGLLYNNNYDPQLIAERTYCKQMCQQYNQLSVADFQERTELIQRLVANIGENFVIEQPFYADYGYNIQIGHHFYANHNLIILDDAKVTIGNYVFFGPNCGLYTAGHPFDIEQRNSGLEYAYPITIGDNVWFGGDVKVMPGVTVGANTVVGAGSIVTKDLPENVIAAGNPCRVIRTLTPGGTQR
ncbi:MAG: sugar O-acetyltransferase [Culicoidibacterales bacterium]